MAPRWLVCLVMVCTWIGSAAADTPTKLTGRVTDVVGKPIAGARVYVLSRTGGRQETTTNKDGRYALDVPTAGAHGVVIAMDKAHTYRTVLVQPGIVTNLDVEVELDTGGGEVIRIVDRKPAVPKVQPKPRQDTRASLPYSDESIERDAWARAWMLLDIDATGVVTRLKLLKAPGFDLDKICMEEAFKLRFDPALDAGGKPMQTYMLYTMEWPAWGWLVQGNGTPLRKPNDSDDLHAMGVNIRSGVDGTEVERGPEGPIDRPIGGPWARPLATATAFQHSLQRVPCAGSGPLNLDLRNRAYRDCSQPDMTLVDALPWITRQTIDTAVADLAKGRLMIVEGPPPSRVPDIISTSVTGVMVVGLVYSFLQYQKYSKLAADTKYLDTIDHARYQKTLDSRHRWEKMTVGTAFATLAASTVTIFLWQRNASPRSFSVQPTPDKGATASYSFSF